MTVKDLIEQLQQFSPDDLIVLSHDGEGNGFAPLADVSDGMYHRGVWHGDVKLRTLTKDDEVRGFTEEDVGLIEDGYKPCVTLWPIG